MPLCNDSLTTIMLDRRGPAVGAALSKGTGVSWKPHVRRKNKPLRQTAKHPGEKILQAIYLGAIIFVLSSVGR